VATKTLVIDGTDREHFFLSVESGTLRVGDVVAHPEGVLRDMRILRIHCEVEVEDDREAVPLDEPGVLAPSSLKAGSPVKLAHAEVSLASETAFDIPASGGTVAEVPLFASPPATSEDAFQLDLDLSNSASDGSGSSTAMETPAVVARRFKVVDGGDQGRSFKLPEEGTISLGRLGHADIGLNDFFVSKVHCLVHIDGYKIMVSHVEGQSGTLIDGMRISVSQKLRTGSILRIGNSHLKLEQGPFAEEPEPIAPPPPPPPPKKVVRAVAIKDPLLDLEGKDFGHFKLNKLLGRGFSGAVFQAEDTKKNQSVAVKVLANEFPASPEELNRFVSEFKIAQGVRHANLVGLQGAGKVGANCWFARELIEGEAAAVVIQRAADGKKPSWTRAARAVVHMARALDELHKHKLFHGNITPNNVLLAKESHAVKLADFRLAEALAGSKLHTAFMEKKRIQEAGYAAPAEINPGIGADLFSLGAVAYAMITGKPPEAEKPPKPSKVYEKVPPEFDKVVMRLLSRKMENRFALPADLLAEMKPICEANDVKL
jgi:hypothetical protein